MFIDVHERGSVLDETAISCFVPEVQGVVVVIENNGWSSSDFGSHEILEAYARLKDSAILACEGDFLSYFYIFQIPFDAGWHEKRSAPIRSERLVSDVFVNPIRFFVWHAFN